MKNLLYTVLLFASVCIAMEACSSGAYVANPSSNANASVNPLNPLTFKQFNWAGTSAFSVNINGSNWTADTAFVVFFDSLQTNYVYAQKGSSIMIMRLANVWGGSVYNMGYKQYGVQSYYLDSLTAPRSSYFYSFNGNSGELCMNENDSLGFKGQFYFQGLDSAGNVNNYSNGYFNLGPVLFVP